MADSADWQLPEYFQTQQPSDCTVMYNDRTYPLHTSILIAKSNTFKDYYEKHGNRKVSLPKDDPFLIEHMLRFFYEGTYDVPAAKEEWTNTNRWFEMSPAGFHAAMAGVASRFDCNELSEYAKRKFADLVLSGKCPAHDLLRMSRTIYAQLPPADRSLRNPLVHRICREFGVCFRTQDPREAELKPENKIGGRFAHAVAQLKHSIFDDFFLAMDILQELCMRMARCTDHQGSIDIGDKYICGTCRNEATFEKHEDPKVDSTSICANCLRRQAAEVWKNGTNPEDGCGGQKWTALEEKLRKMGLNKVKQKPNDPSGNSKSKDEEPWYYLTQGHTNATNVLATNHSLGNNIDKGGL